MFVLDPFYQVDVKLNVKHQHFIMPADNSTNSILMIIDIKTNLPYYNTTDGLVRFKTKCKFIESEQEESQWTDESRQIPYDFSLETDVLVELNRKFFTLYQTAPSGMKLPLVYEVHYQLKAFRDKLTLDQVKKAYQDMTSCLRELSPETSDDRLLISLLLNDISS
jgi:hypothetical protein